MKDILNGSIILTERCNMKCGFCYQTPKQEDMTKETVERVIDFNLANRLQSPNSMNHLIWFGGEPFLNLETLFHGHDYAKEKGFVGSENVVTNCTICSDKILQEFANRPDIEVQLSWQGLPELQEEFRGQSQLVEENVKRFGELPNSIHIQIQVVPGNVARIPKAIDYMHQLIPHKIHLISVRPIPEVEGWNRENIQELHDMTVGLAGKYGETINRVWYCVRGITNESQYCAPGKRFATYTPNGDIYPCHRFYFTRDDRFKIGNVFTGLINNGISRDFEKLHRYCIQGCQGCVAEEICYICPALNYEYTGNVTKVPQQVCDVYRSYMSALTPYIKKEIKEKPIYNCNCDDTTNGIINALANCINNIEEIGRQVIINRDQKYFENIDWKNRRY